MRPRRVGLLLLATALAVGVLAGASVAQADTVARQPFAADSGDTCGGTKGTFVWASGKPAVDATGTLVDSPCGNDGRFASAIFVAYAGGQRVDDEIVRADNGAEEFHFSLVNTGSTAPVERVTVQVCRFAPVPEPPVRCGPKREFRSPFATESPAAPRVLGAGAPDAIKDSYIVVLDEDLDNAAIDALAARYGAAVTSRYHAALFGFAATMSAEQAERLAAEPVVDFVEQDQVVHLDTDQNNPPSWGLDRIDKRNNRDGKYNYSTTASNVRAYVIDTGIRITHSDFGTRASYGRDLVDDDNVASDCNGHGTHVAGTIGGTAHGVAKGVRLIAVRALNCSGTGTTQDVVDGVNWVTSNRILPAVANMSLSGSVTAAIDNAVLNSIASGVTYAVAAGNDNGNACGRSPAHVGQAITVGATDLNDHRASFSNKGNCVDLFAPGVDIRSTLNSSDTATGLNSGTSMAAPHAAGVAALWLATHTTATPAQVQTALVTDYATRGRVVDPGTGSPNRLLYRPKDPNVDVLFCSSFPISTVECSMSYAHATAPVTIRWFAGGNRVASWDDRTSVSGFCTATTSTIRVTVAAANGTDEEQTSFVCEENG